MSEYINASFKGLSPDVIEANKPLKRWAEMWFQIGEFCFWASFVCFSLVIYVCWGDSAYEQVWAAGLLLAAQVVLLILAQVFYIAANRTLDRVMENYLEHLRD